ncbi:ATP-binding protein [Streptomyces sp. NPDC059578]|uniref:ATP-binding protein n=1 Tax=unclassified Streptomyces TaxID=2593676 RepID=UPI00364A7FA0
MSFTMTPRIVRVIRRQANRARELLHWGGDQDAAVLVVSELTTDAILHTRPSIPTGLLRLKLATQADGGLMVDVSDPMPGRREDGVDVGREGGYGLVLVRCVASLTWAPDRNGKTVRAVLPATH